MFEESTDHARRVVVLGVDEARTRHHDRLGIDHLLLGLFRERDGVATHALRALGLTAEDRPGPITPHPNRPHGTCRPPAREAATPRPTSSRPAARPGCGKVPPMAVSRKTRKITMFTVTHTALGGSEALDTTDYPQETDSFAVHDSGALIVSRSTEQVIYAPGTWLRVHQCTAASPDLSGSYV